METAAPTGTDTLTPRLGRLAERTPVRFDQKIVAVTVVPFVAFLVLHVAHAIPPSFAILLLFLGGPHVLATFGLYLDGEVRELARSDPRRFVAVPLLTMVASMVAFGVIRGQAAVTLLVAFVLWQTYHFTKQNLGMFAFWCRASGQEGMATPERKLILATTAIGGLGVLRAFSVAPSLDRPLQVAGLVLLTAGTVHAIRLARGRRRLALLAAVAFYAPLHLFSVGILEASFAYQAAHGAQYYLMVGHTIRADRRAVRLTIPLVLIGGMGLIYATSSGSFDARPWLFGLGKGIVAAHFVADASLWRLRDPGVRTLMKRRFSFL